MKCLYRVKKSLERKRLCVGKRKGNQEFCFGQVRFEILMLHSMNVNQGVGAGYAFGHISEHMVFKVTGMN